MERIIKAPDGGLVGEVKISYQTISPSNAFLRRNNAGPQPLALIISTKYGILCGTIRLEGEVSANPLFVLEIDTMPPTLAIKMKAVEDFGADFPELPENVVWDAGAEVDFNIMSSDRLMEARIRMGPVKYYPEMAMGGAGAGKEYVTTKRFLDQILPQIAKELDGMGILKEGAILALLKFKAELPSHGHESDERKAGVRQADRMLGRIMEECHRTVILMHRDRSIRVAGMSFLGRGAMPDSREIAKKERQI